MSAKFYYLHLVPKKDILLDDDRIVKQLNRARNWISIPPYTWILYSTASADQWYQRFKKFVQPEGNLFICELDVTPGHRAGWMGKKFWNWLKQCLKRSSST